MLAQACLNNIITVSIPVLVVPSGLCAALSFPAAVSATTDHDKSTIFPDGTEDGEFTTVIQQQKFKPTDT